MIQILHLQNLYCVKIIKISNCMRCLIPFLDLFYMNFLIIRQEIAFKNICSFKIEHERKQNPHSKFAHKRISMIQTWSKFDRGSPFRSYIYFKKYYNLENYGISNLRTFLGLWCILKFEQIRVIHEKDNHTLIASGAIRRKVYLKQWKYN